MTHIYISPFGAVDPHDYGYRYIAIAPVTATDLKSDSIDMRTEKVAYFAISATNRTGIYYDDPQTFKWLDTRRPITLLAHSIWLYDVTHDAEAHQRFADLLEQAGLTDQAQRERSW